MKILVYKLIIVINIGFKLQKSCKAYLKHFAAFCLFVFFSKIMVSEFSFLGILIPMFKSLHWRQQITSLYYCIFFTVLPRSHTSDFFENSYKITLVIKVKPSTDI